MSEDSNTENIENLANAIERTQKLQVQYRGRGMTSNLEIFNFFSDILSHLLKNQLVILQTLAADEVRRTEYETFLRSQRSQRSPHSS